MSVRRPVHLLRGLLSALSAAGLAMVLGCSPATTQSLDAAPEPAPSTVAVTGDVTVLLNDVARAFGTVGAPTDVISEGAGVAIAATELTEALELGDQPAAVVAGLAHAWSLLPPARQVSVEVVRAAVVGSVQGDPAARLDVETEVARAGSPTQVTTAEYLVAWDGGELTLLTPVQESGGRVVVDTGRGLSSPTGAARRFLELVEAQRWAAVERLAQGINVERTALEVLRTTVADAEEVHLVQVVAPNGPDGGESGVVEGGALVYAVSGTNQVLARFGVAVEERLVVYERTD